MLISGATNVALLTLIPDHMSGAIALKDGYKFAVLAVSDLRASGLPTNLVTAPPYAISSALPTGALDTWQDDIGRFHREELDEECIFLWSIAPSERTEVLDHENERLKRDVYHFYLGLLIAVPYFSSGRLTSLTGANIDGISRVRSLTTFPGSYRTLGSPRALLSSSRIKLASTLATQIQAHQKAYGQSRFTRALRTFREATESPNLDQRLHQFTRCAEGLVVPPMRKSGKHFAQRLTRICKGLPTQQLEELYTMRGGIEHLHGPYDRLPKGLSKRQRWLRVVLRTIQAEAVARFLLYAYLVHPYLWPHFQSRPEIDAFWELPTRQFNRLWPVKLDFASIAKSFDSSETNRQKTLL